MAGGDVPWPAAPWDLSERGDYGDLGGNSRVILDGGMDQRLCVVHWNPSDPEGSDALARLIAVAPEMAEALRLVIGMADGDDAELDGGGEEICPFELCRAILTRIRGEQ